MGVRCVVKDKVTQLKLPNEVKPDSCKVQRSRTTGVLRIEMPLVDPHRVREKREVQPELQPLKPEAPPTAPTPARAAAAGPKKSVSLQGIYKDPKRVAKDKPVTLLREVKTTRAPQPHGNDQDGDDDDDDDIPPLESRR